MSNSPLINGVYPASTNNYTQGRNTSIQKITVHHMAGILTAAQCGAIFQNPTRYGSSNYGIGNGGEIGLYVDESNTPWTDSNWDSNCKSVTIETSNCEIGGDWRISDAVLNSLIKLCADIAKRNNLGKLIPGQNLTWHSMYTATACPGDYLRSKMQYIADEANRINEEPEPTPEPVEEFNIGDKVIIDGPLYVSSNAAEASGSISNKVTYITRKNPGSAHPYNTTDDLGWMDTVNIRKYEEPISNQGLNIGDSVEIVSTGNGSSYGNSNIAYGIGYRRTILKIYEGQPYPYQVGNEYGTTGFYKAAALRKL